MTVFDSETKPSTIVEIDRDKDYLTELVGEGKKFAEVSDLARGKAEADAFIEQLTRENAEYRSKLQEATTFDNLMKELKTAKTNDGTPVTPSNQPNPSGENETREIEYVSPDQLESLLEQKLQERTTQANRASNVQKVSDELTKQFGNEAQNVLAQIGETSGLSTEELKELAAQRPQVVLNLAKAQTSVSPTSGGDLFSDATPRTSTTQFRNSDDSSGHGFKDQAYYQKMRRDDPKKYARTDIQLEMHKFATKDPDKFFK